MAVFLVPETKYVRPLAAYEGTTNTELGTEATIAGSDPEDLKPVEHFITVNDVRVLDTVNYLPRTLASDMVLFVNKADWSQAISCVKHQIQLFFFLDVFWIFVMNGIFLGVNIAMGLTYGNVLEHEFHWGAKYISVAMAGQIVVASLCIPALGYGSDFIVKYTARRKGGVHEPEHRLLTLIVPLLLGILFSTLYGQAAAHPEKYHWMAVVFTLNGCKCCRSRLLGKARRANLYGRLFHIHWCKYFRHYLLPRRISHTSCLFPCHDLCHARCY